MFAIPLNCKYQIFNGSGRESVRISVTNDAPLTLNLYHNVDFVFNNPCKFPERAGAANQFQGEGEHLEVVRGDGKAKLPGKAGFVDHSLHIQIPVFARRKTDGAKRAIVTVSCPKPGRRSSIAPDWGLNH